MRKALLIAIVLTAARPAWASVDDYRSMAGTGLVMTIGGGISVLTGIAFAIRSIGDDPFWHCFSLTQDVCTPQQKAQFVAQEASDERVAKWTLIGGLASLAVGIPLLCVGTRLVHREGERVFSTWVAPTNGGVMAGITVRAF